MRKGVKKLTALTLTTVMSAGVILAGCGNKQTNTNETSTVEDSDGKKKITVGLQANSFINDYDENYFTKLLEERLGVELEFYMLPQDTTELRTKVSLMVTNGKDMPDVIICDNSLTSETILDYGSKGAFLKLNDYINDKEKAPNFNAIPEEDKTAMIEAITCADGNIYSLPKYEPETWNLTPNRLFINGAWLEKLGLEVPKTTDDLYEVLKAFRDKDPNGNGVQDEIGVYGYSGGGYGQQTQWALMNSFVFYNGGGQNGGLAIDDNGKVIAPFTTEGWKKGLEYMNMLYKEGLLAASMFTDDETQFKATLNADTSVVGLVSAGSTGNWPDVDNNKNFQELDIIRPLEGPDGLAYTPYSEYTPSNNFFITSACKDPDLAFQLGDLFFDSEISKSSRFGEEGVDWTEDPEECAKISNALVTAGLYDKINLVYNTNIWAENSSQFWHNVAPRYASLELGNTIGNGLKGYDPNLKSVMLNAFCYEYYYPAHPDVVLPVLHYTIEEVNKISQAITNIKDYVNQSTAEFITGARSTTDDWDSYIKDLNNMELQTWLKCAQTAYDRMK
ncbi:MAG: hypothetical protein ACLRZ7_07775 [Lachnospiraceae bacterium]